MLNSNPVLTRKLFIRDLKNHLAKNGVSPERFASEAQLSHMTIRRWLKRKDDERISAKYNPILLPIFSRAPVIPHSVTPQTDFSADRLMQEIEKSSQDFKDVATLERDLNEKLKNTRVDPIFLDYCKRLFFSIKSPRTSLKSKAIAVGALLYFISPIDLIPDYIPVVGHMDDLAVLALAIHSLASEEAKKSKENKPEFKS